MAAGLVLVLTLICLNMLIAWLISRSRKFVELVNGTPVLPGRDGQIFEDVVKKRRVASRDVEQALRQADCPLQGMKCAFLEADGKITSLQKYAAGSHFLAALQMQGQPPPHANDE